MRPLPSYTYKSCARRRLAYISLTFAVSLDTRAVNQQFQRVASVKRRNVYGQGSQVPSKGT